MAYKKTEPHIPLACKKVEKVRLRNNPKLINGIHLEIKALKKFDHPNIIKLYFSLETEKEFIMIMELANGGSLL